MNTISRRSFGQSLLGSLLSYALVKTFNEVDVLANTIKPPIHKWLIELESLCKDLKKTTLMQAEWQNRVEDLFRRVELSHVLRTINFDRLVRTIKLSDKREAVRGIELPRLEGVPADLTYAILFEALRKDRAIAPHGHQNMATMHLILRGEVHLRQYERLADEPSHLVISQSTDKLCRAGDLSTVSDEKNNIHWFKGISDVTYICSVGIFGINPRQSFVGREYVDPNGGEKIRDGVLRVKRLEQNAAFRLYNRPSV
jgi:hypothetical protein